MTNSKLFKHSNDLIMYIDIYMSILESLNLFNKSVRSQSKLELEFRFHTIHQKSVFENIYNSLLENGFERDFEAFIKNLFFQS